MKENNPLSYSVVIATYHRAEPLRRVLESLAIQTLLPQKVVIVDASEGHETEAVAASFSNRLQIDYLHSQPPSSAMQRNIGMDRCESPLVVFVDDDSTVAPATLELLHSVFVERGDEIGGVSARVEGQSHRQPRGLLWWYYRMQAGYNHPHYGGKLFGPAINCIPCYDLADTELIFAQWLPSTCVMFRTDYVKRERFPEFSGYSFMEDVHLSARIAKTHQLYFHSAAWIRHEDAPSAFKRSKREMARHRLGNQRRVAREVMEQSGLLFELKFFMHRLFASVAVVRLCSENWTEELIGLWT